MEESERTLMDAINTLTKRHTIPSSSSKCMKKGSTSIHVIIKHGMDMKAGGFLQCDFASLFLNICLVFHLLFLFVLLEWGLRGYDKTKARGSVFCGFDASCDGNGFMSNVT